MIENLSGDPWENLTPQDRAAFRRIGREHREHLAALDRQIEIERRALNIARVVYCQAWYAPWRRLRTFWCRDCGKWHRPPECGWRSADVDVDADQPEDHKDQHDHE